MRIIGDGCFIDFCCAENKKPDFCISYCRCEDYIGDNSHCDRSLSFEASHLPVPYHGQCQCISGYRSTSTGKNCLIRKYLLVIGYIPTLTLSFLHDVLRNSEASLRENLGEKIIWYYLNNNILSKSTLITLRCAACNTTKHHTCNTTKHHTCNTTIHHICNTIRHGNR